MNMPPLETRPFRIRWLGRVRYRDATWEANCHDHTIEAGRKATLVYRDNLVWVVEPSNSPDDADLP